MLPVGAVTWPQSVATAAGESITLGRLMPTPTRKVLPGALMRPWVVHSPTRPMPEKEVLQDGLAYRDVAE